MSDLDVVIARLGLTDLFERAGRDGTWFWSHYQGLWLSPAELRKAIGEGRFRWSAENWELRDPEDQLAAYDAEAADLAKRREAFAARIKATARA
jgi:hypothetical protein